MRIAIGSLLQATIRPGPVVMMEAFTSRYFHRDRDLLGGFRDARAAVPGFISVLHAAGVDIVPLIATDGGAGGPVMRETFHVLAVELVHALAARRPVDGVLLGLDGAMQVDDEPEATAEILERIRNVLPPFTPIGVALRGHCGITPRMRQPGVIVRRMPPDRARRSVRRRAARGTPAAGRAHQSS